MAVYGVKPDLSLLKNQTFHDELVNLYDDLVELTALNHFYYDATRNLLADYNAEVDRQSVLGVTLMANWLKERGEKILFETKIALQVPK